MVKQGYKQTEIGVIPEDWEVKFVKEFTNCTAGGTPSTQIKEYWNGNIPWMNSGELNKKKVYDVENSITELGYNNSSTKLIPEKCVLIGLAGQGKTRGTVAINFMELCINQSIGAFLPSKQYITEYLFYNLENRYEEIRGLSSGDGGRGGLNLQILKSLQIPLPPLPEQEAIAEALSDADAWIESLEQLIAKKRLIKQGAMQELLRPKDGWEVKKLGEVATYRRGSFPQPYGLDKWYDDTNGMPFIQVFDVAKNRKLKPDTKRKISDLAQPMSVFVPKGTIVLTIQGSIGRIALTQYDAYCDRTLLIFEKIDSGLDKFYFLLTVEQIFEIEKEKAPGGTIKTITKEALSDFVIKYPKSLPEQTRIATILSDMDAELEALEQKLSKARQIKQGMMQELLTGRVRLL